MLFIYLRTHIYIYLFSFELNKLFTLPNIDWNTIKIHLCKNLPEFVGVHVRLDSEYKRFVQYLTTYVN